METLYCLDKKGKVRVFQVQADYVFGKFDTYTGLLDGKLIVKANTVRPKANRTLAQQIDLEVQAVLKEKRDEGYKSLRELQDRLDDMPVEIQIQWRPEANIQSLYNLIGVKFNSNKDWFLLPQLAEKWRDFKNKVSYPVIVQPKLNGVRCPIFWNPKINDVTLMSRGGEYYNVPHIANELREYLRTHQHIILDGEIYKHGVPLQIISGACRLEQLSLLDSRQSFLEYHIYDVPDLLNKQSQREANRYLIKDQFNSKVIQFVESSYASSEADVLALHDKYVAAGYEGAIVRDPSSLYQFGFRDKSILKVKNYIDEEFEIIGREVDLDTGIGESFVFVLRNNTSTDTFKARPTGTIKMKEYWHNNINDYIGKKATVRYQERSNDGLPIQGHVRAKDSTILMEAIRDYE